MDLVNREGRLKGLGNEKGTLQELMKDLSDKPEIKKQFEMLKNRKLTSKEINN